MASMAHLTGTMGLDFPQVRYTRAKSQLEATLIFIGVVAVPLSFKFLVIGLGFRFDSSNARC